MPFERTDKEEPRQEKKAPTQGKPKRDRKLGDEWADWKGDSTEDCITETGMKFLLLGFAVILLICGALAFLWFLIQPRILQLGPVGQEAARISILVLFAVPALLYLILLIQMGLGIPLLPYRFNERFLFFLLPKTIWLGKWFGLSRDRVGHSFIQVNNAITRIHGRAPAKRHLLVLLPRCLQASVRKEIKRVAQQHPLRMSTVGGGEEARKVIQQERPDFIIAMACERDLITGIRDVAMDIPVIGIPNQRPEGPCKNTLIRIEDFEQALKTVLGETEKVGE